MQWKSLDSLRESRFTNYINICSNISYLFLLLFFIDFLSLGSGKITEIAYGISTREIFFGLTFLFTLPLIFIKRKEALSNLFVAFVGLFLLVVAVNAVRGFMAGNELSIIESDVSGYMSLLLLPAAFVILYSRERIEFLLKIAILLCAIFAFCSLILSYYAFFHQTFAETINVFLHEYTIGSISPLAGNGTRVYFHTASRWLFPSFLFATYFLVFQREKRFWYIAVMALFEAALFITYGRSFFLGVAICVVLFLILCGVFFPQYLKRLLMIWGIAMFCGTAVLTMISVTQQFNVFSAMMARTEIAGEEFSVNEDGSDSPKNEIPSANQPGDEVGNSDGVGQPDTDAQNGDDADQKKSGDDTGQMPLGHDAAQANQEGYLNIETELNSNAERAIKVEQLTALIKEAPWFGHGLGTRITFGNGYVEYFYHDVIVKMGIFGLFCFFLPFFYGVVTLYRRKSGRSGGLPQTLLVSMMYFIIISYFNPCLNTVTGLSLYILFLSICYFIRDKRINGDVRQ